jgi:hypothetical protein
MSNIGKALRWGVSVAVGCTLMFSTSVASADLVKCAATIEKEATKLANTISKNLAKCLDTVRKKGANAGAEGCEKALGKVYNFGGAAGKGAINKFIAKIQKTTAKGEKGCTALDYQELGYLVSGVNAPGAAIDDFAITWLVKAKEMLAIKDVIFEVGDAQTLLQSAIDVGENPDKACDPGKGKNCGTDCTGSPGPTEFYRPNLCYFDGQLSPPCRTHACTTTPASAAFIQPLGLPVDLGNKRLAIELCNLPAADSGSDLPITGDDFLLVVNQPARTFAPPPVVPISGGITVCLDQYRSMGWCDCTDQDIPSDITLCQDHITNNNTGIDDCGFPVSLGTPEVGEAGTDCACGFPLAAAGGPCSTPGCLACVNVNNGARCHSGTTNGIALGAFSGASDPGSCVDLNAIKLTLLPPGICLTTLGGVLPEPVAIGQCQSGTGPADPGCAALGGEFCAGSEGADGVFCTKDDLLPAANPTTVPFVSGTSTSIVENAVAAEGACSGGDTPGMNCASDADCANGTCAGVSLTTLTFGVGPAAGAPSCAQLESSNLQGLTLNGSFPAVDGSGGLNDTVTTFTFECQ